MFGDYLGVGAGAHSKLSFAGRIVRQMRYKQPKQYMESAAAGSAIQEQHDVAVNEIGFEFMMNALRLNQGFPAALFGERTGMPLTAVLKELDAAEQRGLITRDALRIAPTERGGGSSTTCCSFSGGGAASGPLRCARLAWRRRSVTFCGCL